MKFSDIKIQHIYNVNFDPVRKCEFNLHHFAVVLNKNLDKRTVIVMPLTTSNRGDGLNKVNIGILKTLPSSLQTGPTYAVFNQIRTLNVSRFKPMLDGADNIMECPMSIPNFNMLIRLGVSQIMYGVDNDNQISILKNLYDTQCINKAVNLAYDILRLKKKSPCSKTDIIKIEKIIQNTLFNVEYKLKPKDIDLGIQNILDEITGDI